MYCEFRVRGHLSSIWSDWLDGITMTNLASQETLLAGHIADQAVLLGILNQLHSMNIQILSITCENNPTPPLDGVG
jgi:hypothetical protein